MNDEKSNDPTSRSDEVPEERPEEQSETSPAARSGSMESAPGGEELAQQMAQATTDVSRAAAEAAMQPMASPTAPSLTSELNNIDFAKMIGGPLQAAVDAQVASSLATVQFIKEVGFTQANGGEPELVMVEFSHKRKDVDAEGKDVEKDISLRVPLLAMLPIPSLRIEHVIIDFNVKLNSVESTTASSEFGGGVEGKGGWGPVSFKVTASYQRKTATNVEVKKEYALNVNVKAVQDEIPAGLEKCLNIIGG
jgi:hypothetical protein